MFFKKGSDGKDVERQMQIFEIEMMQNVFSNMTDCCLSKCIPKSFNDGELTQGEAVCVDRCAAKFMQTYMHVTKKLASLSNTSQKPPIAA